MAMYESPIHVGCIDELTSNWIEQTEDAIVAKARMVMQIDIDKEELRKALRYDRAQYAEGYAQGRRDGYKERDDEIVRCGECRWWETEAKCETKNYGTCTIPLSHINTHCIVPEDYYCADGKRKE